MASEGNSGIIHRINERVNLSRSELFATPILVAALVVTALLTLLIYNTVETQERRVFVTEAREIHQQLVSRLEAHALMLRATASFFNMSDTVTRNEWKDYVLDARIYRYLPDVQGLGYAMIIPAAKLDEHIMTIRNEGFPDYSVYPSHNRDFYTSTVYVEPFTGLNRRAFGYDMYTDSVRRRAMETSCDYNMAAFTDRFRLNIQTGGEELYGVLMFVPVYKKNLPAETMQERRSAIKGWLYSPYRVKALMDDLLITFHTEKGFKVQLYNEKVSEGTLLYDNHGIGSEMKKGFGTVELVIPINFNTNVWHLYFSRPGVFPVRAMITLATGVLISLLLYFLARVFSKIALRSAQIRSQNEELRILNATKDKFFSIIAHDLKSPYNAVMGFSDVLVQKADEMDRQGVIRYSRIIRKSAGLAVDLLMNLMVWSHSQTGRMEFEPRELEVAELFQEVSLLYSDIATQKGIVVSTHLPAELKVHADRAMVSTILRNLVSNALKFTHQGGRVSLSAEKQGKKLLFKVADTGVGIPEEHIDKLFRIDEHYITHGTMKEKGTGLGLILCREFIEKHGGQIWVESKTGDEHGSTFFFTLPANDA